MDLYRRKPVYPRVGGGNRPAQKLHIKPRGLSPRGRGKHIGFVMDTPTSGSIPAWAGETAALIDPNLIDKVYPRVGGGNRPCNAAHAQQRGLSPRGRGKPNRSFQCVIRQGSIPAWAGETAALIDPNLIDKVYPRVGGGNRPCNAAHAQQRGLSPRGRGKPNRSFQCVIRQGSIPAWAGETCRRLWRRRRAGVYPRVGGGNPARLSLRMQTEGLSPRGRGKHRAVIAYAKRRRSIPAWAGETVLR